MKTILKLAAIACASAMTAPAAAVTVTSVRVTSAVPSYLQIGEFQLFNGATNVAGTGTATASSTWNATSTADKAIDGDTSTDFYSANGIYHSQGASGSEFWNLAFTSPVNATALTIFGRTDCCQSELRNIYNVTLFNGATALRTVTLDTNATGFASAAVPEPAAWAMMIGGFGLLGAASRRRRAARVVTA